MKNSNYIGRAYLKVSYTKDEGMHKSSTDSNSSRRVLSHLRYIGFRSRELDQEKDTYGLFNRDHDQVDMKTFYRKIERDPALYHPNTVKLHKFIVGFHRDWYDRYNIDYKEMTRHIMKKLEHEKGMKLDWVAAEHLKENSPHVHIAVKSTGVDEHGQTKRLKVTRDDIDRIKDEIDRYTGREQILERQQELERGGMSPDLMKDLTKEIERQTKEGERSSEQSRRHAEREERKKRNQRDR